MADPQRLHDQLLGLAKPPVAGSVPTALTLYGPAAALTAVLELHKPDGLGGWATCEECSDEESDRPSYVDWPCETVRVISTALGVVVVDG